MNNSKSKIASLQLLSELFKNVLKMNKKNNLLFDSQYFPTINWFKNSINKTDVKINSYVRYKKRSFYNRCAVAGGNGLIFLTVPLQGGRNGNQRELFSNVKISYAENWQQQHLKTIETCYRNAPYFEFYMPELLPFFEQKFEYLFEYNISIIEKINSLIFKNQLNISVGDYLKNAEYETEQTKIISYFPDDFQRIEDAPVYYQLFEDRIGFQPNISILDLIFMEGNNTLNILNTSI